MSSVWNRFIDEYQETLPYRSLRTILESFYFFSRDNEPEAEKVMRGTDETPKVA
jgi:hypothetical protein